MATVNLRQTVCIELTAEEFRLVSAALFGRLKDEQVAEAKTLGEELQTKRLSTFKSTNAQLERTLENIKAAASEPQPTS